MSDVIIVAIISLAGTALGTFSGILTSSKLTTYRIKQLEIKVKEHNDYARRLPEVEHQVARNNEQCGRVPVLEERVKVLNHRIEDLERCEPREK